MSGIKSNSPGEFGLWFCSCDAYSCQSRKVTITLPAGSNRNIDLHTAHGFTKPTGDGTSSQHVSKPPMLPWWQRFLQYLYLILPSIMRSRSSSVCNGSKEVINFLIVVGDVEVSRIGVALLDTGSDFDWISSEFARHFGVALDTSTRVMIAETITGHPVYSYGELEGRWRCIDRPCRPRFEVSKFHIVDCPSIDIGIGRETLERTGLYRRNFKLMAPFRTAVASASASQDEEEARKAKERQEKARQARAENEARKETKPSS